MPTAKTAKVSKAKSTTKKSSKKVTKNVSTAKQYKPVNQYDNSRNLAIGGVIGLFLSYLIVSRALNTGSYWAYFFGLAILIIAIRLFIRSIRLK